MTGTRYERTHRQFGSVGPGPDHHRDRLVVSIPLLAPKTWKEWASAGVVQAFIIVLVYFLLARSEERKVEEQFGDEYREYRKRVPMFIPRWGQWRKLATMRDDTPA